VKIEDVMTTEVATVAPGTSLKEVARELVERRISGMPVVDGEGHVLGVISEADLIVKERGEPPQRGGLLARLVDRDDHDDHAKLEARVAGEAMTSPAITIESRRLVGAAAAVMLDRQINRLPVLKNGHLVGIVTRADLVRVFARSETEIMGEIRSQVDFMQALWNDRRHVEVSVDAGEVTLRGTVAKRSGAEILPKVVESVPGVVAVRSDLAWMENDL
jgi:CBS domain-containing protein